MLEKESKMTDRKEAFAAWKTGTLSDKHLDKVIADLELAAEILSAVEERSMTQLGLVLELQSAKSMKHAREKYNKKYAKKIKVIATDDQQFDYGNRR